MTLKDRLSPYLKGIRGKIKVFAGEVARLAKYGFVALTAAATATAYALKRLIQEAVSYGVTLDKMSKQTSMTTEEFARLAYAAEQEHASTESLTKIMPILAKYMEYARQGMETYKREFDKMKVSVVNARGELKSTYEVLLEMAEYYKSAANKTQALAIATTLLGRRGAELVPLLKLGKEGIKELGDEAERMGIVIDSKTAASLKDFDDKLTSIKAGLKGAKVAITTALLPVLDDIAVKLKSIDWGDERIKEWAKDVGETVIRAIGSIMKFMAGLKIVWRSLLAITSTVFAGISNAVEDFKIKIETMKIVFNTALKGMLEGLRSFLERLKPFARTLKIDIVDSGYNKLSEAIDDFSERIGESRSEIEKSKALMDANREVIRDQWLEIGSLGDEMVRIEDETEKYVALLRTEATAVKETTNTLKENAQALEEVKNKSSYWAENMNSLKETLKSWSSSAKDIGKAAGEIITKTMDDIASGTAKAFRKTLEEGKDFKESMKELFRSLMFDITEEVIRSGLKALLAELFTVGAPQGAGGGGGLAGIIRGITGFFTKGHEGGRVTPFGIRRYHAGGFPGLKQDEVMAVLQTGERVLNRREAKNYEKGKKSFNIVVNQVIQAWDAGDVWRNRDTLAMGVAEAIKRNSTIREVIREYA